MFRPLIQEPHAILTKADAAPGDVAISEASACRHRLTSLEHEVSGLRLCLAVSWFNELGCIMWVTRSAVWKLKSAPIFRSHLPACIMKGLLALIVVAEASLGTNSTSPTAVARVPFVELLKENLAHPVKGVDMSKIANTSQSNLTRSGTGCLNNCNNMFTAACNLDHPNDYTERQKCYVAIGLHCQQFCAMQDLMNQIVNMVSVPIVP